MQQTKDSFLLALRSRLKEVNPARTVVVDGMIRPAVIARENERVEIENKIAETFCLSWGEVAAAGAPGKHCLMSMLCTISYFTVGSDELSGIDRGRRLTRLDEELRTILRKPAAAAAKLECGGETTVETPLQIFWREKEWSTQEQVAEALKREVTVTVYFYSGSEA